MTTDATTPDATTGAPQTPTPGQVSATPTPGTLTPPAAPPAQPEGQQTPPADAPKDEQGRPWTVESALAELARVRQEAGRKRAASKNVTDALRSIASEVGVELPDGEPTVESLAAELQTRGTDLEADARGETTAERRQRIYAEEAWKAGVPADRAGYLTYLLSQDPNVGGSQAPDAGSLDAFRASVAGAITTLRGSDPVLRSAGGGGASGADQFGGANGTTAVTPEQFDAMSYEDRLALFHKNPEEYRRLSAR